MILLQLDPSIVEKGLQSDLAILISILILAGLQAFKIWIDYRTKISEKKIQARRDVVLDSIERYLKILSAKYTEEVTDIQMPVIINEMVMHMKEAITVEAAACITRNDVKKQRRETEAKLSQFICNRYKDLILNLGLFKWRGYSMSEFVDTKYREPIVEGVLEIVCSERESEKAQLQAYRNLGSFMNQKFDTLKSSVLSHAYNI